MMEWFSARQDASGLVFPAKDVWTGYLWIGMNQLLGCSSKII